MKQLTLIRKSLTMREFEGYLKGKIIEIRMNLKAEAPVKETLDAILLSETYERVLDELRDRRNSDPD